MREAKLAPLLRGSTVQENSILVSLFCNHPFAVDHTQCLQKRPNDIPVFDPEYTFEDCALILKLVWILNKKLDHNCPVFAQFFHEKLWTIMGNKR
jgi:hypothetical protein